jgi:ATP-binding protein involved in chromosome partitioning
MVTGAIRQFLGEVNWGDLDVLIIDMPPGTGDVQLAVAQGAPISGVVIVSTPQNLALDDAKKAAALFDRTAIPILGVLENMSFFLCPNCGETAEIFGRGGVRAEAELIGAPFLGEIPLHPELREASDEGRLVVSGEGPVAKAFERAADAMLHQAAEMQRPRRRSCSRTKRRQQALTDLPEPLRVLVAAGMGVDAPIAGIGAVWIGRRGDVGVLAIHPGLAGQQR